MPRHIYQGDGSLAAKTSRTHAIYYVNGLQSLNEYIRGFKLETIAFATRHVDNLDFAPDGMLRSIGRSYQNDLIGLFITVPKKCWSALFLYAFEHKRCFRLLEGFKLINERDGAPLSVRSATKYRACTTSQHPPYVLCYYA